MYYRKMNADTQFIRKAMGVFKSKQRYNPLEVISFQVTSPAAKVWTAPRQLESWRQKLRWGLQSLVFVFQ